MSETLHHSTVTKLTGYNRRALWQFVKDGIIECKRDRFGLPRFDPKVVEILKARAVMNKGYVGPRKCRSKNRAANGENAAALTVTTQGKENAEATYRKSDRRSTP